MRINIKMSNMVKVQIRHKNENLKPLTRIPRKKSNIRWSTQTTNRGEISIIYNRRLNQLTNTLPKRKLVIPATKNTSNTRENPKWNTKFKFTTTKRRNKNHMNTESIRQRKLFNKQRKGPFPKWKTKSSQTIKNHNLINKEKEILSTGRFVKLS